MTDRDTLLERELRDTFDSLASTYTPVRLPNDLWSSGRSERRTSRVRLLAAVAVIVALLGGLAAIQQTSGALLPAKTSESGALPKNLYVPSAEEVAEIMARDPLSGMGYEGGRASIATLTSAGDVLLVSATTGEHHIIAGLDIDLVQEDAGGNLPLALSPDGRMLAYAYRERSDDSIEEETGVGVIDLLEGGLGTVTLPLVAPDGLSIEVDDLAWSPDSSHVAWLGYAYVPGEGPTNEDTKWLGSGDANLGGARQWSLESKNGGEISEIVVDNRGRGFVIGNRAWPFGEDPDLSAISPSSGRAFPTDEDWFSMNDRGAALTSDGRMLLLGGPNATGGKPGTTTTHLEVDLDDPELTSTRTGWPMGGSESGGTYLEMLGGTPAGAVVATQNFSPNSIEAVSPDGDFKRLTTIYGFTEASLTVATDLADADPVRFAAPPWAQRPPLWPLVAGVLLVLAAMRIVVRRRRLRRSPDVADAVVNPPSSRAVPNAERTEPAAGRAVVAWGLILLVLLGALAYVSRPSPTGEGVRSADGSVPTTIHLPPDHLTWSTYDVEPSDLDVGRTSALLQTNNRPGPVMLVNATDGRHRVVWLAGQPSGMGSSTDTPTVLSPDGNRLAWTFDDAEEDDFVETVKGVRIADLVTGEVEDVRLNAKDGRAIRIHELTWSPSGAHLAWLGSKPVRKKAKGGHPQQAGVVTPSASGEESAVTKPWELPTSSTSRETIAVDNAGTARVLAGRRLWTLPAPSRGGTPTSRRVTDHGQAWTGAAISPDGRHFVTGLNHAGDGNSYVSGLATLDLNTPDSQMVTHPWRALPLGSGSRVVGWTPDGDAVVSHHVRDLHEQSSSEQLSVVTESGTATPLTAVNTNSFTVSVATDLASNPLEFPEPVWPRSDERKWVLGLLGVAALGAALKLVGALRRRRTSVAAAHM